MLASAFLCLHHMHAQERTTMLILRGCIRWFTRRRHVDQRMCWHWQECVEQKPSLFFINGGSVLSEMKSMFVTSMMSVMHPPAFLTTQFMIFCTSHSFNLSTHFLTLCESSYRWEMELWYLYKICAEDSKLYWSHLRHVYMLCVSFV